MEDKKNYFTIPYKSKLTWKNIKNSYLQQVFDDGTLLDDYLIEKIEEYEKNNGMMEQYFTFTCEMKPDNIEVTFEPTLNEKNTRRHIKNH